MSDESVYRLTILKRHMLHMNVCVPSDWDDSQIESACDTKEPSGTTAGWKVVKQGDTALNGDPERVACDDNDCRVHVLVEC